jgi:branched-subunit amino acid aminotransferase/4-amino-4-deoxychorismate lyase
MGGVKWWVHHTFSTEFPWVSCGVNRSDPVATLDGHPATETELQALALLNYGHFTTMLVTDLRVRGLSLHLDRLARDCHRVFDTELDRDRVRWVVRQALADTASPVVVRVSVFDPDLDLGHCGASATPHILVTTRSAATPPPPPSRLRSVSYRRDLPETKHVGVFGAVLRRRWAQRAGFDDVLFTTEDGAVTEAATSNIGFIADDGRIIWPRANVLPGVTMTLVSAAYGGPMGTEIVRLSGLPSMRGAFIVNAISGIRTVSAVDDRGWPAEQSVMNVLRQAYRAIPLDAL